MSVPSGVSCYGRDSIITDRYYSSFSSELEGLLRALQKTTKFSRTYFPFPVSSQQSAVSSQHEGNLVRMKDDMVFEAHLLFEKIRLRDDFRGNNGPSLGLSTRTSDIRTSMRKQRASCNPKSWGTFAPPYPIPNSPRFDSFSTSTSYKQCCCLRLSKITLLHTTPNDE